MHSVQLVVALLVVLVALVALAIRLNISYPIVLVLGGLLLAIPPRLPVIHLEPDIVFLVFLPPLLFSDAVNSSWRDFRENWRPIFLLSVGLVLATTFSVMLVAHLLLGMAWGPAFVLGAVLGPTDTVAVGAILERFPIPRRLNAILRGESLVNDASALVLFEAAIHTTQQKSYVGGTIISHFCLAVAGGVIIGGVVGWLAVQLRRHTTDPLLANTISLLAAFAAYQPAAALHVSGVLAVVTAGLYLGWNDPRTSTPRARLQAAGSWEMLTFLLNGVLFILIGLQLRTVGEPLWSQNPWLLLGGGIAVSATVICARIAWVFVSTSWPWKWALLLTRHSPSVDRSQAKPQAILLSWVGIRGGISLAAALAIPPTLADGSPFPQRAEVIIFTFAVILVTLLGQGLTLPKLLSWLQFGLQPSTESDEIKARLAMATTAVHYLTSLEEPDAAKGKAIAHLYDIYGQEMETPSAESSEPAGHPPSPSLRRDGLSQTQFLGSVVSLELAIVKEQRARLIELRAKGAITDDVLRRYQSILDLKESQLDQTRSSWEV
ncbi:MAG: Na+/H+ antiporter [Verrucomicrobia bacterium]|nr:Na+/H+ antiporter [Verrucomicrobiota bacterium]